MRQDTFDRSHSQATAVNRQLCLHKQHILISSYSIACNTVTQELRIVPRWFHLFIKCLKIIRSKLNDVCKLSNPYYINEMKLLPPELFHYLSRLPLLAHLVHPELFLQFLGTTYVEIVYK